MALPEFVRLSHRSDEQQNNYKIADSTEHGRCPWCDGRNGQPNRLLRRGPCIVFKTSTKSPRHGKTNRAKVQRVSPELNGKTASAHRGGRRKACCPFLS